MAGQQRAIPAPPIENDAWDRLILVAIFFGILATVFAAGRHGIFDPVLLAARQGGWQAILVRPSILWFAMGMLLLTVRATLWLRYREAPWATAEAAPCLTIVIPAFNEGSMVERTIDSCARAHYPRGRLQIIAIDDGSRDDTWRYIERAANHHAGLVTAVRFPENRGKRAALAEGFRRARGDIVVTVDSDSLIEPQTLFAIAGPFQNPRVGAVAGKVVVFNRYRGLLPAMLHVRFVLSFDFLRSVQSTYGTVYCCPGALAAYRTSLLREIVPGWERQRFLGVECTIGEDRALTNEILARGYDTVYQRSAIVHTLVPDTYAKLCRMYLRWDRSYIREELRLARIVWKRPPIPRLLALFETTITNLRYPVSWATLVLIASLSMHDPSTIFRVMISIGLASTFYSLFYLRSERSWSFVYGLLYSYLAFFTLAWIFPYALLTVRARGWLTR